MLEEKNVFEYINELIVNWVTTICDPSAWPDLTGEEIEEEVLRLVENYDAQDDEDAANIIFLSSVLGALLDAHMLDFRYIARLVNETDPE